MTRSYSPELSDEEILSMPSVLTGSPARWPTRCPDTAKSTDVSSFTVQDNNIANFSKVIAELR